MFTLAYGERDSLLPYTHQLLPDNTGISIASWKITSKKSHIATSAELETVSKDVGIPPPEMYFGENELLFKTFLGFEYAFRPIDALRGVQNTATSEDSLKVAYAEDWMKERKHLEEIKKIVKPFDWTYSTDYSGTLISAPDGQKFEETNDQIPYELLKQSDKILYYNEIQLFEDELGDNGVASLFVKVRVMEKYFYVLQRFFLLVDNVIVRINETRLFHAFASPCLLREFRSREEKYDVVKSKLPLIPGNESLKLLTDSDWVSSVMNSEPTIQRTEKIRIVPSSYDQLQIQKKNVEKIFV